MACPYCGKPADELDDVHSMDFIRYPYIEVVFNAHCDECGKTFRQRYWAKMDMDNYENIKEEDYESE